MREGFVQRYASMRWQPMRVCHLTMLAFMHAIRDLDSWTHFKSYNRKRRNLLMLKNAMSLVSHPAKLNSLIEIWLLKN
jgi:hypothetical protein